MLYSLVFRISVPVLTHEFFSAETVMEVIFFCQFSFRQGDTVAFTILVWFCGWSLVLVFLSVIPVLFSFVGTTVKHGGLTPPLLFPLLVFTAVSCFGDPTFLVSNFVKSSTPFTLFFINILLPTIC